jgi:hypothetical protein
VAARPFEVQRPPFYEADPQISEKVFLVLSKVFVSMLSSFSSLYWLPFYQYPVNIANPR